MGRKVRLFLKDTAQCIQINAIDKESIFREHNDYIFYIKLLKELSYSFHVSIHAYTLLEKSIHILCTFTSKDTLSRFMQSLGLKYVSYYNKKYNREGTLWKGRYKSSLVDDKYILSVMSYIESLSSILKNSNFTSVYSSFNFNAKAIEDDILLEHEMYKLLGKNKKDRAFAYNNRYNIIVSDKNQISYIKNSIQKQDVIGDKEFRQKVEKYTGISLSPKKRGRPKTKSKKGEKMFSKLVVLDKEQHKELKVSPLQNLEFAKDLSFVPILINEVPFVTEIFPVIFTKDEIPELVCLTSLGGKNLAINEEGKYIARYVPAFLRKYPFALTSSKENPEQKVVLIDEGAKNVSKTKGKQLFTKDGEQSELLKNAIKFLTDYEQQHQQTIAVVKAIKESGILVDKEISIEDGEEKKVLVKGFQVVDRTKLNKLEDKILAEWVRKGIINFIDLHIKSLEKIETLFKIASQKQQKPEQ